MEKQKTVKTALYGGSFDPLHFGHIDIVKNLAKRFDTVLVMPCKISPFKQSVNLTDAKLRLSMLKKAFKGLENVKVMQDELKAQGVSYTQNTVEKLRKKYDNIHVVIGSEEAPFLPKWNNSELLKKQVVFYIVPRPHFELDDMTLKALKKDKFKIKVAPFCGLEFSSSLIKLDLAFDKPNYFMPDEVHAVVRKNGLYNGYAYYVSGYPDFDMTGARVRHTYRAVKEGLFLAKLYGADTDKVTVALLLHDIGKYADIEKLKKQGLKFGQDLESLPSPVRHAVVGKEIAEKVFEISDEEILGAIEYHTTGRPQMSLTEKVVFAADYTEEGRDFENLDNIREALREDLDTGIELILENTLQYLKNSQNEICPLTREAYDYYQAKNADKVRVKSEKQEKAKQRLEKADKKQAQPKQAEQSVPFDFTAEISKNNTQIKAEAAPMGLVSDGYALKQGYDEKALASYIAACLSDKKARDITLIDLKGKTIIADYFVICSASSTTQVKALADYVDEKLSKTYKIEPLRRDVDTKWAAVDYGSVIVHIFYEETRKFYQLERLWVDGENAEVFKD